MCHLEYERAFWISDIFHKLSKERSHNYLSRLIESNNIMCPQEIHGKDECLQALQMPAPCF